MNQVKPATPLPWSSDPEGEVAVSIEGADGNVVCDVHGAAADNRNAAYIVHACNNFPRMVDALRKAMYAVPSAEHCREIQDLLVSIGEAK